MDELENIIHALDENMNSICGSHWDFGRILKDFNPKLSDRFNEFTKCQKCIDKINQLEKERNE